MSASDQIRDRLRAQPLPGEADAAARCWPVVEAALAERAPGRRRAVASPRRPSGSRSWPPCSPRASPSRCPRRAPPWATGSATASPRTTPARAGLRGASAGRLRARDLAQRRVSIRPDGSTRRLGAFLSAGWSPHGLHVVGAEGRRLVAVDAAGTVKWTLTSRRPWAPGMEHRARLRGRVPRGPVAEGGGRQRRSDHEPGAPPRRRAGDPRLAAAQRPRPHLRDRVRGAHDHRRPDRAHPVDRSGAAAARALAWARGGRRLVALGSRSVTVLDRSGRILRTIPLSGVAHAMALHPSGKRAAVVVGRRVLGLRLAGGEPRQLFQGGVDGIAWSADGSRLLLGWRDADQWLLLGPGGRITALHGVSGELGAAGGFPRVAQWCCAG